MWGMKKPARSKRKPTNAKAQRTRGKRHKGKPGRAAVSLATRRHRAGGRMDGISLKGMRRMTQSMFGDEAHAKRVESLANGATGVMVAKRAAIHAIGAAYAEVAEIKPKHGVKQVDRYLSNQGIDVEALTPSWARFVLGSRREVILALDWTEFDASDHSTLCAYVVTTHGRATPLCWKTVQKSTCTDGLRTEVEVELIERLARAIPPEVAITLLADRGFGNQVLYEMLELLGWDYNIRFRGNITVQYNGESRPASDWLPPSGRAIKLRGAHVTHDQTPVGAVVVVRAKGMKDIWCLATNLADTSAAAIARLYGRRFTIEETFRDQKDLRFGMGLRQTRIRKPARRDRLLMLLAVAQALLTLLGAASERSGLDAYLKVNTVKRRTHSLFRQGSYWFGCLPTMREDWYKRLMAAFAEILAEQAEMREILGAI